MSLPADLDRILEEDDWLRRIARRLAKDAESSEDLVQDAWVAALTRKRGDRPWLFGVLRNLRHEGARRSIREADVRAGLPPPGTSPAADDVVSELLLRKRVTAGLLKLEEPYRTTLYLRYVQDENLPAIARRTKVAVSTVHQRINRGLELLRVQLDEHYEGKRSSWALGLLSLAEPPGAAAGLFGGILMGASAKVVAAMIAVSGGVALVWNSQTEAPVLSAPLVEEQEAVAEAEAVSPIELAPTTQEAREPIAAMASEPPDQEELVASALTSWSGRVIDLDGVPLGGATVVFENASSDAESSRRTTQTDAMGAFTLSVPTTTDGDPKFVCDEDGWTTLLQGVPAGGERIVVVGRITDFAGVVVDDSGTPIPNAELRLSLRQSLFRDLAIPRPFTNLDFDRTIKTNASGEFDLPNFCGGEHVGMWVTANGFALESVSLPAHGDSAMRIVLEAPDEEFVLRGYVLDTTGNPVEGASVSAGEDIVSTNVDGAFELGWSDLSTMRTEVLGEGSFGLSSDTSVLRAAFPGSLPAQLTIAELDLAQEIILVLGQESLTLTGRIVDESGVVRPGVIVWVSDLTPFGNQSHETGESRAVWDVSIEELNNSSRHGCGKQTDSEGRFELGGLLDREYQVRAYHISTGTQGGPWTIAAGATDLELTLAAEPDTTRVAGRVVSALGVPIVDAWVSPRRGKDYSIETQPPHLPSVAIGLRTDENGRFEFPALATRGTILALQHELFFIREFDLEGVQNLEELEIVQPLLCDVQVELSWDPDLADSLQILDADGLPVDILESFGAFLATRDSARFIEGKSSVFQAIETGETVVLMKDGVEVLRESIRLDPEELTHVVL